jgi:hypothetical protein
VDGWSIVAASVVSAIGGASVLILGRRIDNRYGLPSDFESQLLKQRTEYTELVKLENEQRRQAEEDCQRKLAESSERERTILRRLDDSELTIDRLRSRLGA